MATMLGAGDRAITRLHDRTVEKTPLADHAASQGSRGGSPEALIRRENRAITVLKIVCIVVLLAGAGAAAGFIFIFTSGSQKKMFKSDFSLISQSMVDSLLDDLGFYFRSAQSISDSLSIVMKASNASHIDFSISLPDYRLMTAEAAKVGHFVTWSPLLRNDAERTRFESMVAAKQESGFFDEGLSPPCFVCGSESMRPSTPNEIVRFSGDGEYTCLVLDESGRRGIIAPGICPLVTEYVLEKCSCVPTDTRFSKHNTRNASQGIFRIAGDENGTLVDEPWSGGPYLPMWLDPTVRQETEPLLYNSLAHRKSAEAVSNMLFSGSPQLTEMFYGTEASFFSKYWYHLHDPRFGPASTMFYPVTSPYSSEIVGALSMPIRWQSLLRSAVPRNGIYAEVLVESSCGEAQTYRVRKEGFNMEWIGPGDTHDPAYDDMVLRTTYDNFNDLRYSTVRSGYKGNEDTAHCAYRFSVYPTAALESQYITNDPLMYSIAVLCLMAFMSSVFLFYDFLVRRRQAKIMKAAMQTDTIVSALFPENVRDRLYNQSSAIGEHAPSHSPMTGQGTFLSGSVKASVFGSEPIADLYPACTVLFLDIANFTAWCSEREPSQVFVLLENLYHTFDEIGDQLGIFKVETIGDSYVAVSGLPKPRTDHAIVMAQFAQMCLDKMQMLVRDLEVSLGPSTGELQARCGLHSGPVTAGVLRGAKARFQLFGDTVNTASRMESSGAPNCIHTSEQTMKLLTEGGKSSWVIPRDELVHIKGKGTLQTFWISLRQNCSVSPNSPFHSRPEHGLELADIPVGDEIGDGCTANGSKKQRLIAWNVEVLHDLLTRVVEKRNSSKGEFESSRARGQRRPVGDLSPNVETRY
jgi:class 3 adenylate cyclase